MPVVFRQARYSAVELDLPTRLAKSLVRDSVESLYHKEYGYVVCVSFRNVFLLHAFYSGWGHRSYTHSIMDFWRFRWHQFIRHVLVGFGARPGCSLLGRPRTLPGAFGVSAVIHNFGM